MIRADPRTAITKDYFESQLNAKSRELSDKEFNEKYSYLKTKFNRADTTTAWLQKRGGSLLRMYDTNKFKEDYDAAISSKQAN